MSKHISQMLAICVQYFGKVDYLCPVKELKNK